MIQVRTLIGVVVLTLCAASMLADDDYVLYHRTGGAVVGLPQTTSYAWAEVVSALDLDQTEQLAIKDIQVRWLKADINQAAPSSKDKLVSHIALIAELAKRLDKTSLEHFREWVQQPTTVKLSSNHWTMPVTPEMKYLLVEFRKSLLGWSAV